MVCSPDNAGSGHKRVTNRAGFRFNPRDSSPATEKHNYDCRAGTRRGCVDAKTFPRRFAEVDVVGLAITHIRAGEVKTGRIE